MDNLGKAYDILTKGEESGMSYEQFQTIMETVIHTSSYFNWTQDDSKLIEILWLFLESNGRIKRSDFIDLGQIMTLDIHIIYLDASHDTTCSRWFPFIYNGRLSQKFCKAVKTVYFRYFFDFMICANVILIALQAETRLIVLDNVFLLLFSFEIIAKLYSYGRKKFMKSFWNVFDSLVISSAILLWLTINYTSVNRDFAEQGYDIVMVLRVLRICKLLGNINRFYLALVTIKSLLPSIITYGGLMIVAFYFYAIVGIHLFQGLVYPDPKGCNSTSINCCSETLASRGLQFCSINFNSISTAFLLLFDLMVVNDWHRFCNNYVIQTGTKWARLYFIAFHLTCVILILNIFTAFVIEAFFLELTNTTEGSAHVNTLLTKIRQLGINAVEKNGKDGKPQKLVNMEILDNVHHEDDDYMPYPPPPIDSCGMVSFHEPSKYRVYVVEKISVEALLVRMFQREIENESRGLC